MKFSFEPSDLQSLRTDVLAVLISEDQTWPKPLRALDKAETNVAEVNQLLKRFALACLPPADVALLSGDAWISFLNDHGPKATDKHFSGSVAHSRKEDAYRDGVKADDDLIDCTRAWIRSVRPGVRKATKPGETR